MTTPVSISQTARFISALAQELDEADKEVKEALTTFLLYQSTLHKAVRKRDSIMESIKLLSSKSY